MNIQLFHRKGSLKDPVSVPCGSQLLDSYVTPRSHGDCHYDLTFVGDLDLPSDEMEEYELYAVTQNVPLAYPLENLEYIGKYNTGIPSLRTGILWKYIFHVKTLPDPALEAVVDTQITKLQGVTKSKKKDLARQIAELV